MPKSSSEAAFTKSRSSRHEALAIAVRRASDAAMKVHQSAAKDRRFLQRLEVDRTDGDTLGEIDEMADTLQGLASWIISGLKYPDPQVALTKIDSLDLLNTGQPVLAEHRQQCPNLCEYVSSLKMLREALHNYFELESNAIGVAHSTEIGLASAKRKRQRHHPQSGRRMAQRG
jgi:hypothetical protein